MEDEIRELQDTFRRLGEEALEGLGDLRDPILDTAVDDARTLRHVLYTLSDHYREHLQPRSDQEPEYTIRRIMEHVVEMEEMRLGHIRQALEGAIA